MVYNKAEKGWSCVENFSSEVILVGEDIGPVTEYFKIGLGDTR